MFEDRRIGWKLGVISLGPQRTLMPFAVGDCRSERKDTID